MFRLSKDLRPYFLAFVPGKYELLAIIFGQPTQFLNMRTGELKQVEPSRSQDQIMRLAFAPAEAPKRLVATALNGRVVISNADPLAQPSAEPIFFQGAFGLPSFSGDGKKILILSGSSWMTLDTVQVWNTQLQERLPETEKLNFDDRLAPPWLADLAEAVNGAEQSLDR